MDELDPLTFDRKLREACRAWSRWRRQLRAAEAFDDEPLLAYRRLSSQQAFQELTDLGDRDPLAPYLRRWVYRLAEQRINAQALASVEAERRANLLVIEEPAHTRCSLAEMFRRALGDSARREGWLHSFLTNSRTLAAGTALLWERRAEIARRMGLPDADSIESCCPELTSAAQALLESTDDMAEAFKTRELSELLSHALGHDLDEGWPGRLSVRSLTDLFAETPLFQGLSLDTGAFPAALAGSSFLRGFARLGSAWVRATAPAQQPFVVACDPYGLRERSVGALLASVACSPVFARRVCGLSGARLQTRTRATARVALLHVRGTALNVLLRRAALEGRSSLNRAFEAQVERVYGLGLPADVAGSVFRLRVDAPARFAGTLLAAKQHAEFVDAHDEDWYRNPRAVDQLRSEAELSPQINCSKADLESGTRALRSALLERLG